MMKPQIHNRKTKNDFNKTQKPKIGLYRKLITKPKDFRRRAFEFPAPSDAAADWLISSEKSCFGEQWRPSGSPRIDLRVLKPGYFPFLKSLGE